MYTYSGDLLKDTITQLGNHGLNTLYVNLIIKKWNLKGDHSDATVTN